MSEVALVSDGPKVDGGAQLGSMDVLRPVIITDDWKGAGGGVETYLVNLVDALRARGVNPTVIFKNGTDPDNIKIDGKGVLFSLRTYLALRRLRPNVVHSHGTWFCMLGGALYGRFNKVNLINTFHTQPVRNMGWLGRAALQRFMAEFDYVTFVSKALERSFQEMYGLEYRRSAVTVAGAKRREVSPEEIERFRTQYSLRSDSIVVLGQALTANKMKAEGAKILMGSSDALRGKYPDLVLILTREGKYSEDLRAFARDRGMDNVIFTGDVANPFVPLTLCDVFAHITLSDGLPLSIVEAMSLGKPILATPVGGIPEIVENGRTGLLVDPSEEEVSRRIDDLLTDKDEARRLGDNAKEFVESNMTWDRTATKFITLYDEESRTALHGANPIQTSALPLERRGH